MKEEKDGVKNPNKPNEAKTEQKVVIITFTLLLKCKSTRLPLCFEETGYIRKAVSYF